MIFCLGSSWERSRRSYSEANEDDVEQIGGHRREGRIAQLRQDFRQS